MKGKSFTIMDYKGNSVMCRWRNRTIKLTLIQQNPLPRIIDATLRVHIIFFAEFEQRGNGGKKLSSAPSQLQMINERQGCISTSTSLNRISDFLFPFLIEPERRSSYVHRNMRR